MPRGIYLSQEVREMVWAHINLFGRTPVQIWRDIFFCIRASLPYVEWLCADAAKDDSTDAFLDPTAIRSGGPKRKMSVNDNAAMLAIQRKNPEKTQVRVLAEIAEMAVFSGLQASWMAAWDGEEYLAWTWRRSHSRPREGHQGRFQLFSAWWNSRTSCEQPFPYVRWQPQRLVNFLNRLNCG